MNKKILKKIFITTISFLAVISVYSININSAGAVAHVLFLTTPFTMTFNGNMGGDVAADTKCQQIANGGTDRLKDTHWKAFLSTSSVSVKDKLLDGDYYNVAGVFLGDKQKLLSGGNLLSAVFLWPQVSEPNIFNMMHPFAWTGSNKFGEYISAKSCSDWTSVSSVGATVNSMYGAFGGDPTDMPCSRDSRIYCFSANPIDTAPTLVATVNGKSTATAGLYGITVDLAGSKDDLLINKTEYDWGDGTSNSYSALVNSNHTYMIPGTYTLKVTITNLGGLQKSFTDQVIVKNNPAMTVVGDTVTFTYNSSYYASIGDSKVFENYNVVIKNYPAGDPFQLYQEHHFKSLNIQNSTVTTHKTNLDCEYLDKLMTIYSDSITLSNSTIDISGKGYLGGLMGKDGAGPGGGGESSLSYFGGGGSYGGQGGTASVVPYNGGRCCASPTYGNPDKPLDLGSGGNGGLNCNGAGASTKYGGDGGGAVAIYSTSLVMNNSFIKANGQDAIQTNAVGAGGGSGGSIYINSQSINISTSDTNFPFSATGGMGSISLGCYPRSNDGGGGGGGRIVLATDSISAVRNGVAFSPTAGNLITVAGGGFVGGSGASGAGGTAEGSGYIKPFVPSVTVSFSASPASVAYNGVSTLSWSSTGATSCTGSGFNSGGAISGSVSTGNITVSKTYSLTCTGPSGSSTKSLTINVTTPPVASGFTFIPTINRGGASIGGVSVIQNGNNYEICTDKTRCPNSPIRAGDQVVLNFLLTADAGGTPFVGGTYNPVKCNIVNVTSSSQINSSSSRTTCKTGTYTPSLISGYQKVSINLQEVGFIELVTTATDGTNTFTKTVIIRVPKIGELK